MSQREVIAEYKGHRVRAFFLGPHLHIDQADLDAITGRPVLANPPGSGFLHPELKAALQQARNYNEEFANWLQKEFEGLTL